MNDDYIKTVSAMVQKRMEAKIKKEFKKLEKRKADVSVGSLSFLNTDKTDKIYRTMKYDEIEKKL